MSDEFVNDYIAAVLAALVGMPNNVLEITHHLFGYTDERCCDQICFHPPVNDKT
jgi:hypothetical protein